MLMGRHITQEWRFRESEAFILAATPSWPVLLPWQEGLLQALGGIAAVTYLLVAIVQGRRRVSSEGRMARNGFVFWWGGLALLGIYGVISALFLDPESFTLTGYRVLLYTFIPIIFIALAGLVYYLLYLYTGKRDLYKVVAIAYALLTVAFVLFVELQDPFVGPDPDTGEIGLQYEAEAPAWAGLLFSIVLVLPPFASAVAYVALLFQTKDRTVRYRILMVGGGIALWMGFSLLGSLGRFASGVEEQSFISQLVGQLLGLLSAVMVLLAYYPPPALRRALELRPVAGDDDGQAPPVDLFDRSRKRMHPVAARLEDVHGRGPSAPRAEASRRTIGTVPGTPA